MKKILFLIALHVIIFTLPCFASSEQTFYDKIDIITLEVYKLAENILAFNKPAFETTLTKQEQAHGVLWNRICVKDKTLVWGYADKFCNKKIFGSYFLRS